MSDSFEFNNSLKCESNTPQQVYDSFNEFIFSRDRKVIGKLIARALLFDQVKDIPGDIVECGVFKGSGVLSWLKVKQLLAPNSNTKVLGFDFFSTEALVNSLKGDEKAHMSELFASRSYSHDSAALDLLHDQIREAGFEGFQYELIPGDVKESTRTFVDQRPGFKISLLYIDLDLGEPSYHALDALWDRVARGGMVVFDDYAIHQWTETQGVDDFFADKDVQINNLHFQIPNAYVVKQ